MENPSKRMKGNFRHWAYVGNTVLSKIYFIKVLRLEGENGVEVQKSIRGLNGDVKKKEN